MSETGFGQHISDLAAAEPQRIAVYIEDTPHTLAELDQSANRLAWVYLEHGVKLNSIITIALPNSFALLVATLAAWKIGAIPNPVSTSMPLRELQSLVSCAESALIVGADAADFAEHQCLPADFVSDTSLSADPLPPLTEHGGERALASSGSTGTPKLIMPSDKAVYNPEFISALFKPEKAVLVPGPLYHAVPFSSTWQGIFNSCTVVMLKRFDAEKCLHYIDKHQVDRLWLVPTMMLRIWKLPEEVKQRYDVSSLKNVLSGGAPLPAWLMQNWIDWLGAPVMNDVFGPSERIGGTMINGAEWVEHPGSVGKPLAYSRMRILDENGNDCAPGQMGEIYMLPATGSGSTYQYKGAVGKTNTEGWESVGDMGYFDEDGYLYLGDRLNDMILSGGRNIYPAEIEAALEEHPLVRSCAVVGMPDADMGSVIYAIVDSAGATLHDDALKEHLNSRLTPYKIPAHFEFVNEPLRNDAGKVRRTGLRAARLEQWQAEKNTGAV